MTPDLTLSRRVRRPLLVLAGGALACLLWAYWTTLLETAQRWSHDPQYSHGYLVPVFAGILLWLRRDRLNLNEVRPSWWGLPLLAAGISVRLFGVYFYYVWLDAVSLLPCVAGLVLLVGGRAAWRWAWPAVAFLAFMIPLPYRMSVMLADPLQRLATIASTFCLQTLGMPALAEGKTILLNDLKIGIVEACSGLRMLVIFFALSTAMALLVRRPLWERLVIAFSAIPIALVSNILRITVTGLLYETAGTEIAEKVFHDLAGWLMMPLALGLLGLEWQILKRLFIEPPGTTATALVLGPQRVAVHVPDAATQRPRRRTPWKPANQPTGSLER
jgi:exosortase